MVRCAVKMKQKKWKPFICGGLASCVAELGTFPIDLTKTRLQVQGQKIDRNLSKIKYNGMIDCLFKISKEEGPRALYSGIWPALLRQSTYGTIKFGAYYTLKKYLTQAGLLINKNTGYEKNWMNVILAAATGAIGSSITNPADVLKVRMQVSGEGLGKLGLFGNFKQIYMLEGIRGLYRGVGPTAQRAGLITAVELPLYDFCKAKFMGLLGDRVTNHFVSSFIAALGATIASTPIDVVRTRLMNQRKLILVSGVTSNTKLYSGSVDCAVQTVRNEGFLALYKGFIPTWVRMGPWNIIFFIIYEQLNHVI